MSMIRQFKLNNGEEIICEVLEWNSDNDPTIVIRHGFRLVTVEDPRVGFRYFTFRPWMTYMDQPSKEMIINAVNIIGESTPTGKLLENYDQTVQAAYESATQPEEESINTTAVNEEEAFESLRKKFLVMVQGDSEEDEIVTSPNSKLH